MKTFLTSVWVWIQAQASIVWHIVGGAVIGAVTPTLTQFAHDSLAGIPIDFHTVLASTTSTAIAAAVGALVGWWQHSSNKTVAAGANLITKDMQDALDKAIADKVTSAIANIGKKAGMILLLCGTLFVFNSPASAQSILNYSNGQLRQEAVTGTLSGGFLALEVQGGFMPLHYSGGAFQWETNNPILTVDYVYVSGTVSPNPSSPNGISLKPDWWAGVAAGGGEFQISNNSSLMVAHGFLGATEGINWVLGELSFAEGFDLDTGAFYIGPSIGAQFDLGSFSLVKIH